MSKEGPYDDRFQSLAPKHVLYRNSIDVYPSDTDIVMYQEIAKKWPQDNQGETHTKDVDDVVVDSLLRKLVVGVSKYFKVDNVCARGVVFDSLENLSYKHLRSVSCVVRTVDARFLQAAGEEGVGGLVFDCSQVRLLELWLFFVRFGAQRDFKFVHLDDVALVTTHNMALFGEVQKRAKQQLCVTPERFTDAVRSVVNGEMAIFARALAVGFGGVHDLWEGLPGYYGIVSLLSPLLAAEPAGVVLGVLCPHIPRDERAVEKLPCCSHKTVVDWYVAAAEAIVDAPDDEERCAWAQRVVRALGLPSTTQYETCSVKYADALSYVDKGICDRAMLFGVVSFVRRFCFGQNDGFVVQVPDVREYTPASVDLLEAAIGSREPSSVRLKKMGGWRGLF